MAGIEERRFKIEVDGVEVAAAITASERGQTAGALAIVPGSFYNDIDGNYASGTGNPFEARPNSYADLARQLAARGQAVLRFARTGRVVVDEVSATGHARFANRAVEAGAFG
jgi:hypothetical protein